MESRKLCRSADRVLPSSTATNREVMALREAHTLRAFQLFTHAEDTALVLADDYVAHVRALQREHRASTRQTAASNSPRGGKGDEGERRPPYPTLKSDAERPAV